LIHPGEDPAEFDQLRASLRREHQPANTTEEILVDELADQFWRIRRMRIFEAQAWRLDEVNGSEGKEWSFEKLISWTNVGVLQLIHRAMASAERRFSKTLVNLRELQRDRGFVPQICEPEETEEAIASEASGSETAYSETAHSESPQQNGSVSQLKKVVKKADPQASYAGT
nr:hypothetical protein [Acidobacteriota bacterium]